MSNLTVVLLVLLAFIVLVGIILYILVAKRKAAKIVLLQLYALLQQRHALILKLTDLLHGQKVIKQEVLAHVLTAQNVAMQALRNLHTHDIYKSPELVEKLFNAEQKLDKALIRLQAVIAQQSIIKSKPEIAGLIDHLNCAENQVSVAKQAYNDQAVIYNNASLKFPYNIMAGTFGFSPMKLLLSNSDEVFSRAAYTS